MSPETYTARCYCGAVRLSASGVITSVYCHCGDCKRWTGAPAPAFAAFEDLRWTPAEPTPRSFAKGVTRWVCAACGSPMAATFDYLPGQTYVPLGVIDQMDALPPAMHCHAHARAPWLDAAGALPSHAASGRDALNGAADEQEDRR